MMRTYRQDSRTLMPIRRCLGAFAVLLGATLGSWHNRAASQTATLEAHRTLVVDAIDDLVDGDVSDGRMSLREAVQLANERPGANTITFASPMSGQTITLNGSELTDTDELTIDARPLDGKITIAAQERSRILKIEPASGGGDFSVTLAGLTLTGGKTTRDFDEGGAIRAAMTGRLILRECTVSGNSTTGLGASGGGIFSKGGVEILNSALTGNRTTGLSASGGGLAAGDVTITQSTVSGNSTEESGSPGGGVYATGRMNLNQSTVTNNRAMRSSGGGVHHAAGDSQAPLEINSSILSGNRAGENGADLTPSVDAAAVSYSLVGAGVAVKAGPGNIVTDDPKLGALADNGGPTQTHALLPGSPAIDSGGVLDDYVISFAANYEFYGIWKSPANNPQVSRGQAHLNPGLDAAAVFVWKGGAALRELGDQASISFGLKFPRNERTIDDHSSAGMALFDKPSGGKLLLEARVNADKVDGRAIHNLEDGQSHVDIAGPITGRMLLTLRVANKRAHSMTVETKLSGVDFPSIAVSRTLYATEAFFGPVAYNVVDDQSTHDNLTFSTAFDQRGQPFERVVGARIDMGAFEAPAVSSSPAKD